MTLTLKDFANRSAFAAAFARVDAPAQLATALPEAVLQLLASGPATWFRLCSDLSSRCTRLQLDQVLADLIATGQVVRIEHIGGFRYGLPDGEDA